MTSGTVESASVAFEMRKPRCARAVREITLYYTVTHTSWFYNCFALVAKKKKKKKIVELTSTWMYSMTQKCHNRSLYTMCSRQMSGMPFQILNLDRC